MSDGARRVLLASWLARLLEREPDAASLKAAVPAARLLLSGPAREAMIAAAVSADVEAVAADFARLFYGVGPTTLHACESSWGEGDGLLFEAARAEMAESLERLKLRPDRDTFREPEDHISIELEAWATALERDDETEASLLQTRLRHWGPRFAARLRSEAREPWLQALALGLEECLA